MYEKKVGKRLLTWVLVLVMTLSLPPMSALADGASPSDVKYGTIDDGKWSETGGNGVNASTGIEGVDSVSKTAKYIGPNEYEITLTVQMHETNEVSTPAVATVLVIDISTSMDDPMDSSTRLAAAKAAAKSFVETYAGSTTNEGIGRYLSIVTFNYKAKTELGWTDVSTIDGKNRADNIINSISTSDRGTNLEQGLAKAKDCLDSLSTDLSGVTINDEYKNVIALTDGAPTCAGENGQIIKDGSSEYNKKTVAAANDVKELAKLYTVCFGDTNEKTYGNDGQKNITVSEFLSTYISSSGCAFEANDSAALNKAFENISKDITTGLSSGTVTDSLPTGVTFKEDVPANFTFENDVYKWELSGATGVDKNGATVYTYEMKYTVTIDPNEIDSDLLIDNEYYPLNGETTLTVTDKDNIEHVIDFPIPAGKVTLPKYTVTYALDDTSETPTTAGNLPTDSGMYASGDTYTIDITYGKDKIEADGYTYTFSGWKLNGTGDVLTDPQTMGSDNVVLKGTWTRTAKEYTLSYATNGGNLVEGKYTSAGPVAFGTQLTTPTKEEVTKTGYTLEGWYPNEELTEQAPGNMPAANLTLYAKWTANTDTGYTVEYYYQNTDGAYPAEANVTKSRTGTTDATISVTDDDMADKENGKYTYDSTQNNVESGTIAANGSLELKLYFKLKEYTVTYMVDGAEYKSAAVPCGTAVTLLTKPTKTGYKFNGWYRDAEYTTEAENFTMPATNVTLYGHFTVNPITPDLDDLDGNGNAAVYKNLTISAGSDSLPSSFSTTFVATIEPKNDEAKDGTMPDSYTGTATVTTDHTKVPFVFECPSINGDIEEESVPYGKLHFTEAGVYTYTVNETIPTDKVSGVTYDQNTYTLTIVVGEGKNGLEVTQYYVSDNAPENGKSTPVTITNTYYKHTYHPSTPSVTKPTLNTADHYAYVMGYPDGTVQPGGYITRAEASTIFFRLLTDETREQYWATTNTYSDIKSGDWYNNAISTLSSAGIVSGYPDGTFRPNAPITRAEMSKIIALFAKLDKTTDRFSDIAGHWAEAYIKLAAGNGWIEGYPDGTFKPQQNITRAETVTMINRVLERVPSDEDHLLSYSVMLTFPDCQPGQWFYIAMQEATNSHTYQRAVTEKNGDEQWTALRANRDWTLLEK